MPESDADALISALAVFTLDRDKVAINYILEEASKAIMNRDYVTASVAVGWAYNIINAAFKALSSAALSYNPDEDSFEEQTEMAVLTLKEKLGRLQ